MNTEYCPVPKFDVIYRPMNKHDISLTFVGTTGHEYFRFDIELSPEGRPIEVFNCLPKAKATLRVGVMIGSHSTQGLISSVRDPFWGCKVHVALAQIDTILRKIGSTEHHLSTVELPPSVQV